MIQPTSPLPIALESAAEPATGFPADACGVIRRAGHCAGYLAAGLAVTASLCFGQVALAATAGEVTHLSGTLAAQRADGGKRLLGVKSQVEEGETLTTAAGTYARVKFVDGAEVVLRPGSELKIQSYSYNVAKPESDNVVLSMLKGGLRAITGLLGKRSRDKVSFQTATATIGIRGTHFGALLCQNDCGNVPTTSGQPPANGLHLDVTDGAIVVSNGAGSIQINLGQFGFVVDSNTPPAIVPPEQGVSVTVPPNIGGGVGSGGECQI